MMTRPAKVDKALKRGLKGLPFTPEGTFEQQEG